MQYSSLPPIAPYWGSKSGVACRERVTEGVVFSLKHNNEVNETGSDCRERALVEGATVEYRQSLARGGA